VCRTAFIYLHAYKFNLTKHPCIATWSHASVCNVRWGRKASLPNAFPRT